MSLWDFMGVKFFNFWPRLTGTQYGWFYGCIFYFWPRFDRAQFMVGFMFFIFGLD